MALIPRRRLGDVLIDCNLITEEQLSASLKEQKKLGERLGETLVRLKVVTNDDIIWALGDQLNISYIHLTDQLIDFNLARSFSEKLIRKHKFIPIFKLGNELTIVMADPLDGDALNVIESLTEFEIKVAISAATEIDFYIDKVFGKEVETADEDRELGSLLFGSPQISLGDIKKLLKALTPEKTIRMMLLDGLKMGSANICLEPHGNSIHLKYRLSGKVMRRLSLPGEVFLQLKTAIATMTGQKEIRNGSRIIIDGEQGTQVELTLSVLEANHGPCLLFTPSGPDSSNPHLKTLGLSSTDLKTIMGAIRESRGLFLVMGPTFNGKETTLKALLNALPSGEMRGALFTSSPISGLGEDILQIHVTGSENIVKAAENDLDFLAFNNIPDGRSLQLLLEAACRRLVVATMNLSDMTSLVHFLDDHRISRKLFFNSTRLIINQRLVRLLCEECREEKLLPEEFTGLIGDEKLRNIHEARGCGKCNRLKYTDRTGLFEVLSLDIFNRGRMLRDESLFTDIYSNSDLLGFRTIREAAIELAGKGLLDINELLHAI
ncbi:MAG: hypothetical protein CVV64_01870 [Candidatus Wallbacteria bacterium HGW-Wallbacteria-1]|jgi:type IV pilus assembly protein PilB|uniref:Bacterial type II secretion system protein E domain-containing protein n=1 Tax=Candidatus Wallbacteria bacterium HGW-Wallbacteria-1 TaxID=2013854 RepID=A0A2N1PV60_9BACT|nr:MAG: hypothetical protein CVV64_01870 [Candidatus Wallbacteria bacterium HGW-Wallbacteria-1]